MDPLKSGAVIGILGGGQLGRMLALAAARLGLQCHVFTPDRHACALQVVQRKTIASFTDRTAIEEFAADCDVITYEFENVPAATAKLLSARRPVRPDAAVLEITQDRLVEKDFVRALGIATAPYAPVHDPGQLATAVDQLGLPAILKTRSSGYDGKGQATIRSRADQRAAWDRLGGTPCILEGYVAFEREVSVVAARAIDGTTVCFDVTENEHHDHILRRSLSPARISARLAQHAKRIAVRIAEEFGYVGVLGVEMFVTRTKDGPAVAVNEIAPRVHNSAHWTVDGATASQFEQHIRAVAGWPLARPTRMGRVEMINLIGADVDACGKWLSMPGTSVHLYGKEKAVPGRKMGHVTRVFHQGGKPAEA